MDLPFEESLAHERGSLSTLHLSPMNYQNIFPTLLPGEARGNPDIQGDS